MESAFNAAQSRACAQIPAGQTCRGQLADPGLASAQFETTTSWARWWPQRDPPAPLSPHSRLTGPDTVLAPHSRWKPPGGGQVEGRDGPGPGDQRTFPRTGSPQETKRWEWGAWQTGRMPERGIRTSVPRVSFPTSRWWKEDGPLCLLATPKAQEITSKAKAFDDLQVQNNDVGRENFDRKEDPPEATRGGADTPRWSAALDRVQGQRLPRRPGSQVVARWRKEDGPPTFWSWSSKVRCGAAPGFGGRGRGAPEGDGGGGGFNRVSTSRSPDPSRSGPLNISDPGEFPRRSGGLHRLSLPGSKAKGCAWRGPPPTPP